MSAQKKPRLLMTIEERAVSRRVRQLLIDRTPSINFRRAIRRWAKRVGTEPRKPVSPKAT